MVLSSRSSSSLFHYIPSLFIVLDMPFVYGFNDNDDDTSTATDDTDTNCC